MTAPHALSLTEAAAELRAGRLSVPELVADLLDRRDRVEPRVHAWAAVHSRGDLLRDVEALQASLPDRSDPLHGMPYAAKDMIDTADLPTEGGSAVLAGRRPDRDATCVAQARDHGALLLGKAQTHEFAFGVRTPQTHNPWDPERTAGGSSGGSAAAVASGTATWALGTDTLGSVRMPAAMCGVVGLKPTLGALSTEGVLPLAATLDCVGLLTRTVADAGAIFQALTGAADTPLPARLRVATLPGQSLGPLEPEVTEAYEHCLAALSDGHEVHELGAGDVLGLDEQVQIGFGLMLPEGAAWHRPYLMRPDPPYDPGILATLRSGLTVPAVDYLDALAARAALVRQYRAVLDRADVIVTPAAPYLAPRSADPEFAWPDGSAEPLETSMCRFTAAASLTGLPAVSVPVGVRRGLPVSVQVIAGAGREDLAVHVASLVERRLPLPDPA